VSADSSASPAAVITPLPQRAAIAILGSMILLIIALTAVLVQTTWIDPVGAGEQPAVESEHLAQR
jgi:hypothetical protein